MDGKYLILMVFELLLVENVVLNGFRGKSLVLMDVIVMIFLFEELEEL